MKMYDYCSKCHKMGNGCCFLKIETYDQMFGISNEEIRIIIKDQNINESDFIVQDIVKEEFLKNIEQLDVNLKKMFPNNIRKKLRIVNNQCIFLTKDGCKLSVEARPLYCRLYPFWVKNKEIVVFISDLCIVQQNADILKIMERLNVNSDLIFELYRDFILYWDKQLKIF